MSAIIFILYAVQGIVLGLMGHDPSTPEFWGVVFLTSLVQIMEAWRHAK